MPGIVVCDDALQLELLIISDRLWNDTDPVTYHLYQNDLAPDRDTVLGDFVECDFSGYAPIAVPAWTSPGVDAHVASSRPVTTPLVWTLDSLAVPGNIYGYYVTDVTGGLLRWSERVVDADPFGLIAIGQSFFLYPIREYYSWYPLAP